MALKRVEYDGKAFGISYEITNSKKRQDIIFLHGWGSSKEIMKQAFKNELEDFRHIYVDMPGFGKSSNEYSLDTNDYFHIMDSLIKEAGFKKDVILGHSFGGKVGALLEPKLLVLLSSAGIPAKKPIWVKIKIFLFKLLKPFGGKNLYKLFATKDAEGMSKNMYETLKRVVDEDFSPVFSRYKKDALVFWGTEDKATPLKCGKKMASLLENSEFFECEGDHFFFLKAGRFVSENIKRKYRI